DVSVWYLGETQPLEVVSNPPEKEDRLVVFKKPGSHMIKLAVVNGKQTTEKTAVVQVAPPPKNAVSASVMLYVTDQATAVTTVETPINFTETYPSNAPASFKIDRQISAQAGYEIKDARLQPVSDKNVKDLNLQVLADRKSVKLTGVWTKPAGMFASKSP